MESCACEISTNHAGIITHWDDSAESLFGIKHTDALGRHISQIITAADQPLTKEHWDTLVQCNHKPVEKLLSNRNGDFFASEIIAKCHHNGESVGTLYTIRPISGTINQGSLLQRELQNNRALAAILDLSIQSISFKERLHKSLDIILSVPWLPVQKKGAIFLKHQEEQLSLFVHEGLPNSISSKCAKVEMGDCLCGRAAQESRILFTPSSSLEIERCPDSNTPHGNYSAPIIYEGEVKGLLSIYLHEGHEQVAEEMNFLQTVCSTLGNIIHKHQLEMELQFNADYDSLTGLPNRRLLTKRAEACIDKYQRNHNKLYVVFFLDLDRFKNINDSLGHTLGDSVLVEVGERIKEELRTCDTVSRLGGDEFVILLEDIPSFASTLKIAQRILDSLKQPIATQQAEIITSASIGITFCCRAYTDFDDILRDADTAMFHAKADNDSHIVVFDTEMRRQAHNFLNIEHSMRTGLRKREFTLHFQPVFDITQGRFIGAESLLRWNHPGKNYSPFEFIPVAEETGLILELGEFVIQESCRSIARLKQSFPDVPFYVTINLSGKQILHHSLLDVIDHALMDSAISTELIKMEITESVFLNDMQITQRHLQEIKDRGIDLLIDDFGTGYSSLSFLQKFPFDSVKVDRAFVMGIHEDSDRQSIVRTIIDLAKNLDMSVVVEGVETEEDHAYIRSLGCSMIQGYYYSKPIPYDELSKLISKQAVTA